MSAPARGARKRRMVAEAVKTAARAPAAAEGAEAMKADAGTHVAPAGGRPGRPWPRPVRPASDQTGRAFRVEPEHVATVG